MARGSDLPEEGELVVGTVKDVQGFGAKIDLEEYPGKEGFIHISEVATGWVKRIRDYVREQQRVVCKVTSIDPKRGHVDVSLKRVNAHQRRETIQEWKNEQKAEKLLEIVSERLKIDVAKAWEEFGNSLRERFGSLYAAFEEFAYDPEAMKTEEGLKGKWVDVFSEVAAENISIPWVDLKGYVDLQCTQVDGVKRIRAALEEAPKGQFEDVEIVAQYVGAPTYRIKVRAPDAKTAAGELEKAAQRVIKRIEKEGGTGSFRDEAEAPAA